MPKINLLPQQVAELIAAGEVVERPASVIKELIENSIDAGATRITVEIKRGGILLMRIADNGSGIAREDVPLAFLRHATSKISTQNDLDSIHTLGFRGEALAATAAVSRIDMMTKTASEDCGTHYRIEGGVEILCEDLGCNDGTTIVVSDLFYNTPARMKFLKKDVSEGNAVAAVLDRVALSHPEIAFRLIREGKTTLSTPGDGKLESAIYSVLGRDFTKSLIPVSAESGRIAVSGFTCKPVFCRKSRAGQFTFINGRLVHSGTVNAAVDQAYKNSAMVGKFPAFVLNLSVPYDLVDVNVHPAKTEVRFAEEQRVFEAVYYAVKNALFGGDTRPVIEVAAKKTAFSPFANMPVEEYRQQAIPAQKTTAEQAYQSVLKSAPAGNNAQANRLNDTKEPFFVHSDVAEFKAKFAPPVQTTPVPFTAKKFVDVTVEVEEEPEIKTETEVVPIAEKESVSKAVQTEPVASQQTSEDLPEIRLIGEAFRTYIIVEQGSSVFLIDKHAAHERMIFNRLKNEQTVEVQQLLAPIRVSLSKEEYDAVLSNTELMLKAGFEIEDFGSGTVLVRAVPATLTGEDVPSIICEAASSLCVRGNIELEVLDHLYHTVACKAAIKAGSSTNSAEMLQLAQRVLTDRNVMYCPHGRPVAYEIKRYDLEKQFGRIQ